MAILARPVATRLGPAIPAGFGTVMKWVMDNSDGVNCPWCGQAHGQKDAGRGGRTASQRALLRSAHAAAGAPKRKRKVSAYQKRFGVELKRLKKKHPRTPVTRLMKRAHTATKKARRRS